MLNIVIYFGIIIVHWEINAHRFFGHKPYTHKFTSPYTFEKRYEWVGNVL